MFFPAMADSANLKLLPSPKCMAGGFATTRTDSAQFSIEIRPARDIGFSQKRLSFVQERESECKNGEFYSRPLVFLTGLGGSNLPRLVLRGVQTDRANGRGRKAAGRVAVYFAQLPQGAPAIRFIGNFISIQRQPGAIV